MNNNESSDQTELYYLKPFKVKVHLTFYQLEYIHLSSYHQWAQPSLLSFLGR